MRCCSGICPIVHVPGELECHHGITTKSQIGNSVICHLNRKRAALNNDLTEHTLFKANWVAWLLLLPSHETIGCGFLLHASETSVSPSSTCTRGGTCTLYPRALRGFHAGASSTHEGIEAWRPHRLGAHEFRRASLLCLQRTSPA